MKTIYLIGFMGAGKTYCAKQLSSALKLPYYDTDTAICRISGKTIPEIFKSFGESYFRILEKDVILGWDDIGIVATGGGCVENLEIRNFLKQDEFLTVWLKPDWDILVARILDSDRPLVGSKSEMELRELYKSREKYYQEVADIIFTGSDLNELINLIEKALNNN